MSHPSHAPPQRVNSPLLRGWLTHGGTSLDPWLAAANGLALAFLGVAFAGPGSYDLRPHSLVPPSINFSEPVLTELTSPQEADLALPQQSDVQASDPEEVPDTPVWRDIPEMVEPVAVVEPVRPLPVKTAAAQPVKTPRPVTTDSRSALQNPLRSNSPATSSGSPGAGSAALSGSFRPERAGSGNGLGTTPQPPYPAFARRDRLQGTVVLAISVSNGAVSGVRVVSSSGSGALDTYAIGHVQKRWKWPPGTTRTYTQPFRFVLK